MWRGLLLLGVAGAAGLAWALMPGGGTARGLPSWDWQLSEPFALDRVVDVLDIDATSVRAADVAEIKARGTYLICYVSVGTVEAYRRDAGDFPGAVVGRVYADWPDEKFLDIRRLDVLMPLMEKRFRRCEEMGFDAIEPDNMDVYQNDSGFSLSKADTVAYVAALAEMAHGLGLEIGQKNVPELTEDLVGMLDFAIAEACFDDGWCGALRPYLEAGKPVYAAEYTDTPVNFDAACAEAARLGISMVLKDRDLTAAYRACE
ncbi:MAG: endo alpha-1,4 polygalactosaminidase [Pseudomonadota bacterium]